MAEDDEIREPVSAALDALKALWHFKLNGWEVELLCDSLSSIDSFPREIRYALNNAVDALAQEGGQIIIEQIPGQAPEIIGQPRYTTRARNEEQNQKNALLLLWKIEFHQATMKANGGKPLRGSIFDAAYEKVAETSHMSVDKLKHLIKRYGPKGNSRQEIKKNAQETAQRKLQEPSTAGGQF